MKSTYLRTIYVLAVAVAFAIFFIEIVNVIILRQVNYRSGEIYRESLEYYADFWNERLKAVNIEMIHITNIEETTGKDYEVLLYAEDNLEFQIEKRVMMNRLTQLSSIYGSDIAFFIYLPEKDTLISSATGNLDYHRI